MLCVDVFSGTGGISLALKGLCHTIQYCEIHPYCNQVLVERMENGQLDKAPIHNDITNLHISSYVKPTMIAGGFPCQDISSMGLQQGIKEGSRSGLFNEIMRIVSECPTIQIVFLENVTNILKCGMNEVIDGLISHGFNFQWTIRQASAFGAPHVRGRWFCLAVRGDISEYITTLGDKLKVVETIENWPECDVPPVVFKPNVSPDNSYDKNWAVRCQCLGNAVVPKVVRFAYLELLRGYTKWNQISGILSITIFRNIIW
jgi:DNA (cytosine-5)-methyltransferase 1